MHLEFFQQWIFSIIFISLGKMQSHLWMQRTEEQNKNCHTLTMHTFEMKKWIYRKLNEWMQTMVAVNRINFSFIYSIFYCFLFFLFISCGETVVGLNSIYLLMFAQFDRKNNLSAALSRRHSFHFSTRNELETNLIDFFCSVCVVPAVCERLRRRYVVQCYLVACDGQRCH